MKPLICLPPMVKEEITNGCLFKMCVTFHEYNASLTNDSGVLSRQSSTPEDAIAALETALLKQEETK